MTVTYLYCFSADHNGKAIKIFVIHECVFSTIFWPDPTTKNFNRAKWCVSD